VALIQRADLVEKIRALFGVTEGSVGNQLVDEIIPIVIVEDVSGPDQVSTQHPLRAWGHSNSAAAVGFLSKVGLQNPVGSEVDLFVEAVDIGLDVANNISINQGVIAASPNAGLKRWKDGRVQGNPIGIIWDENATVSLGVLVTQYRLVGETVRRTLGITLSPGQSVHVQARAANVALLTQTFHWIERIRRA